MNVISLVNRQLLGVSIMFLIDYVYFTLGNNNNCYNPGAWLIVWSCDLNIAKTSVHTVISVI